ncbi:MAG: hypothetical protein WC608_01055 [Parcubacteria group bacterium]
MPEFQIELSELQIGCINIEAENKKEAKKKAFKLVKKCGFDLLDSEIFRKITKRKVSLVK